VIFLITEENGVLRVIFLITEENGVLQIESGNFYQELFISSM